jgi:catechol 2,3-dioxygenase-like lactoylglutathione lyase family enzyme
MAVGRRATLLAAGAVAVVVIAVAAVSASGAPRAPARADGSTPGLVGVDHFGVTVPNIAQAVAWFRDVMGCTTPLSFGPFLDPKGSLMKNLLRVNKRAVIKQITHVRCGKSASIELFQYSAPDQKQTFQLNSDWGGHHVAFYVTDINKAVAYMRAKHVRHLFGPFPVTAGPAAGQTINYFRSPFGLYIELISYPRGMAYEQAGKGKLWSPKRNGLTDVDKGGPPGLLGVDHFGVTVPNITQAATWFRNVMGCTTPLSFGPFADPKGALMKNLLEVNKRAVIKQITHVRCGNGPSVELFQYSSPDQKKTFQSNSDWGGHHVAFYVKDINKAVAYLRARGVQHLFGPFPVTAGPAAGQTINYFYTPFGLFIELISYPHGMAYEQTAPVKLWSPKRNAP